MATERDELPDGLHDSWFQSGTFMNYKVMVVAWTKPGVCNDVPRCIYWCYLLFFFSNTRLGLMGQDGEMTGTDRHINIEGRVDE